MSPRLWDLLPTTIRVKLAALAKLHCFWDKNDELQLEIPLGPMEPLEEIDKVMRRPPGVKQ